MSGDGGPLLYSRSESGHRAAYLALLSRLLGGVRGDRGAVLATCRPVLFLMIEEDFGLYLLAAMVRGLTGRRTAGLLFRPGPALHGATLRTRLKRGVLRLLRRFRLTTTLTILPFAVEPRFADIADGWVDDLQMWDLSDEDVAAVRRVRQQPTGLAAEIRQVAAERAVVLALGRQSTDKGFDRFAAVYRDDPKLRERLLFVAAGMLDPELEVAAADLEQAGGLVVDGQLSDAELLDGYAAADFVWCCYAPEYDQASGILGRAAQLGVPVIVRAGSLLQRLCASEGIAHVVFGPDEQLTIDRGVAETGLRAGEMRERSIGVLREALGMAR